MGHQRRGDPHSWRQVKRSEDINEKYYANIEKQASLELSDWLKWDEMV